MRTVLVIIAYFIFVSTSFASSIQNFELPVFKQKSTFSLSKTLETKKVVINFWATWCTACIKEIKELEALKNKYPDFEFVAINAGDSKKKIKRFLKKYNFTYKVLLDKGRGISKKLGVLELPRTMVIDKKMNIIYNSNIPPLKL